MLIIKLSAPLGNYANDAPPTTYISQKVWLKVITYTVANKTRLPNECFWKRLSKREKVEVFKHSVKYSGRYICSCDVHFLQRSLSKRETENLRMGNSLFVEKWDHTEVYKKKTVEIEEIRECWAFLVQLERTRPPHRRGGLLRGKFWSS